MEGRIEREEIDRMTLAEAEEFYDQELVTGCNNILTWRQLLYLENRIAKLKQKDKNKT